MIYGHDGTIHGIQHLNVELDKNGQVVSVWFRCMALPFDQTIVESSRAKEMRNMSKDVNKKCKINAVDIDIEEEKEL